MKVPVVLLLTDIHIERDNLNIVSSILIQSLDLAAKMKIKYIFILGDIFTERTGQNQFCLNVFWDYVIRFEKLGIKLVAIPGNHDKVDLNIKDSYLRVYSGYTNVAIVESAFNLNMGDLIFSFIPYFKDRDIYLNQFKELSFNKNKLNFLCTHQAFNGVRNNDGEFVTKGISPKEVEKFDKVFTGHYHNKSKVGGNIYYIGATHAHDYGENNDKGFTIVYNDGSHELIKSVFPKFIKKKFILSEINKVEIEGERKKYANSKHNVRFRFVGTDDELMTIHTKSFESVGIEVKKEPIKILRGINLAVQKQIVQFNKGEIKKNFLIYCAQNKISGEKRRVGQKYINKI